MKSIEQKKIGEPSPEAIDFAKRMIALKWTKETNVDTIASCWQAGYLFGQIDSGSKYGRDWISVIDGDTINFPKEEGKYVCCNYYKCHDGKYAYSVFVSNFKFFRMRTTNEKIIGQDGETGCFSDNLGYASGVTHWMPLPEPPKS